MQMKFTNIKINKEKPHLKWIWETRRENPDARVTQRTLLTPTRRDIHCISEKK